MRSLADEMAETMKLCVSCKACRRECPTGVDMARMKIEVQAARAEKYGLSLHDRLVGYLPRYAPRAAKYARLANMRNRSRTLRDITQRMTGFSATRSLPQWRQDIFHDRSDWSYNAKAEGDLSRDVVLFADTFNRYFERENLEAAVAVLAAGGYRVHAALPPMATNDRSAAAAHSSRSARCTRQGAKWSARSPRCALRRARHAGDRAGAELPARLPRRDAGAVAQ